MITKLAEILQGWSTHDDEDMSRRKLDQIRPESGRKSRSLKMTPNEGSLIGSPLYIYINTDFLRCGRPHQSSVRMSIFRPLPGRIWSSFLLDICRSSCVDHPCKISANLVIVKAPKIVFFHCMSVSDRFWPSVNQIDFESLNYHQIGWNFARMIYTQWSRYV